MGEGGGGAYDQNFKVHVQTPNNRSALGDIIYIV